MGSLFLPRVSVVTSAFLFCFALLTFPASAETNEAWLHTGSVTGTFVLEATVALESVPPDVRRQLAARGWRVELVKALDAALPELAAERPRGWPAGWTWANVDAVHLPGDKRLVFAEWRRSRAGTWVRTNRLSGVVRHELGHAWDVAWSSVPYSDCEPFYSCYERDRSRMSAERRQELGYFVQASSAGRQEVFAELFALRFGGGSTPQQAAALRTAFPSCAALIDELFAGVNEERASRDGAISVVSRGSRPE